MALSFYTPDRAVATPERSGEYSPLAAGRISEIDLTSEYGQQLLLLAVVHALCRDGLSDDEIVERVGHFGSGRTGGPVAAEPQVSLALSTAREQRAAAYAVSKHFGSPYAWAGRREMLSDVHQLLSAGWTADAITAVAMVPSAFGVRASEYLAQLRALPAVELEAYVRYVVFLAQWHRALRNLQLRAEAWYTEVNWDDWRRPNSLRWWHAGLLMLHWAGNTRQVVASVRQMALFAGIGTAGDGNASDAEHRASYKLVERGAVERHSIARDEAKQRALDPMQARTLLQLHPAEEWLPDRLGSSAGGSLAHKLTDAGRVQATALMWSPGDVAANHIDAVAWTPPELGSLLHPLFGYVALGMLAGAIWHLLGMGELPATEVARLLGADVKVVRRKLSELAEHELAERQGKLWVPGPAHPDRVAESMPVMLPQQHFVADRPRLQAESYGRNRAAYREVVARGALRSGDSPEPVTVASIVGEQPEPLALPERAGGSDEAGLSPAPVPAERVGAELLTEDEIKQRVAALAAAD